jgi:hypothetical protein
MEAQTNDPYDKLLDRDAMNDRIAAPESEIERTFMMGSETLENAIWELVGYHQLRREFFRQLLPAGSRQWLPKDEG